MTGYVAVHEMATMLVVHCSFGLGCRRSALFDVMYERGRCWARWGWTKPAPYRRIYRRIL